jgi:hypothetical protein
MRMYKCKITKWGLDKKNKKHEVLALLRLQAQRSAIGKSSVFELRGRPVDNKAIQRYQKRKGITIRDVVMPLIPQGVGAPALRCTTPPLKDRSLTLSRTPIIPSSTLRCTIPVVRYEPPTFTHYNVPKTLDPVEGILTRFVPTLMARSKLDYG